jgi:hypothetical protein
MTTPSLPSENKEVQVFADLEPEITEVTYRIHQDLEVYVSAENKTYEICVKYGETVEAGQSEPRERCAICIDLQEVPPTELAEVRRIVAQYLRDHDIVVDDDTEYITQ